MPDLNNIDEIMKHILYNQHEMLGEEPPEDAVLVEGVINYGFHPERLQEKRQKIIDELNTLPEVFFRDIGGGMSMLEGCRDRNGSVWTGQQRYVIALFSLGIAIGVVEDLLGPEMWPHLPGGLPYYVINLPEEKDNESPTVDPDVTADTDSL